jgi:SSS family solute:Na+ symporter
LKLSRLFTVFWGSLIVFFSFFVGGISDSVITSVNKVGSMANGPILAMFLLGILTKSANEKGAISGLIVGLLSNAALWVFAPQVSWFWWNVSGFLVAFIVGMGVSKLTGGTTKPLEGLVWYRGVDKEFEYEVHWPSRYGVMIGYSVAMVAFCVGLTAWL